MYYCSRIRALHFVSYGSGSHNLLEKFDQDIVFSSTFASLNMFSTWLEERQRLSKCTVTAHTTIMASTI